MASGDVFPKDWSLFVSNDNESFTNIIKNKSLCAQGNVINKDDRDVCKKKTR